MSYKAKPFSLSYLAANQTSDIGVGDKINLTEVFGDLTIGSNLITLKGGYSYIIWSTGNPGLFSDASAYVGYRFYNEDTSAYIGSEGASINVAYPAYNAGQITTAAAVVIAEEDTDISLRIDAVANLTNLTAGYTNVWVERI